MQRPGQRQDGDDGGDARSPNRTVARRPPVSFSRYHGLRTIALIPAYNEEAAIGGVVAAALAHVPAVLVVDDGSTDATPVAAADAGAAVLSLPANRGKAGAVRAGLAAARARGCEAVVLLDGDGQHDPAEIPGVLAPVLAGEADLVIGSRHLGIASAIPLHRVLGQKALDLATALAAGVSLSDTQSGFRALGPAALDHLDFPASGYDLESAMIAHVAARDLRIAEVPISCRYDLTARRHVHPVRQLGQVGSAMLRLAVVRRSAVLAAGLSSSPAGPSAPARRPP